MALPRHPGEDDETLVKNAVSRRAQLVIAFVVALIILVVVLHLTGVIKQ